MTLGEKIASARKEKGMTQEMLAEQLGVTRQAVARWETGLSVPDAGMLVRIAGALDTTVNDLLGEEEPEQGRDLAAELEALNRQLAEMVGRVGGYDVRIEEVHHTQKKDAPSGTAITLAEEIIGRIGTKERWVNRPAADPSELAIASIREGTVPGIHTVTYTSADDVLTLRHEILNRRTLALGAVIAAEFLNGKRGVYTMDDLLKQAAKRDDSDEKVSDHRRTPDRIASLPTQTEQLRHGKNQGNPA